MDLYKMNGSPLAREAQRHHLCAEAVAGAGSRRVPVDNNQCEQMMRPVAQGRKSWLFAGSLRGGERLAELLPCRRQGD